MNDIPKRNPNSLKNLKPPFSKENQPKKRGRKPSLVKKYIKDYDLTYDDVSRLAKTVLQYTEADIQKQALNKQAPMVLRLFCRFLAQDMKNGNAKNIDLLLERAVGSVKDHVDLKLSGDKDSPLQINITTPPPINESDD